MQKTDITCSSLETMIFFFSIGFSMKCFESASGTSVAGCRFGLLFSKRQLESNYAIGAKRLFMLRSHQRAIRFERRDCPFAIDRGTLLVFQV